MKEIHMKGPRIEPCRAPLSMEMEGGEGGEGEEEGRVGEDEGEERGEEEGGREEEKEEDGKEEEEEAGEGSTAPANSKSALEKDSCTE
jgi:hypothetical protein